MMPAQAKMASKSSFGLLTANHQGQRAVLRLAGMTFQYLRAKELLVAAESHIWTLHGVP